LFTLTKNRETMGARMIALRIVVEFLQLFRVCSTPHDTTTTVATSATAQPHHFVAHTICKAVI